MNKKGTIYPSEKTVTTDRNTGITIWQMTNVPANHSNLYYTKGSFTPDGKNIVVLSCRTGYSNLFLISLVSGEILQLTDHMQDIPLLPPCLSPDGEVVYYTLGSSIRSVNRRTLEEDEVAQFSDTYPGVLSISNDGSFIVTRLNPGLANVRGEFKRIAKWMKTGLGEESGIGPAFASLLRALLSRFLSRGSYRVVLVSTQTPSYAREIASVDESGITLLSPDNTHILIHKLEKEIWCCDLSGGNLRHLYGKGTGKWLTHPNWLSKDEILVADWPNALIAVKLDGTTRVVNKFNLRHPTVSPDGSIIACDTTLPDTGLYAISAATGEKKVLFYPESSEQKQWAKARPPVRLPFLHFFLRDQFGSEWEHTHQSFSPDGSKIVFNSTRGGTHSQVFVALIR
jgi:hypothetical protein